MSLDRYLRIGETVQLGSHLFEAEAIKAFARKFDPQPFHLDEQAARASVFGALCASGWHTASVWMKLSLAHGGAGDSKRWSGPGPEPVFGPSPGFTNLRWLRPVFAGETISFARTSLQHRGLPSRPGWRLLTARAEGWTEDVQVIGFDSAVLVQVGSAAE